MSVSGQLRLVRRTQPFFLGASQINKVSCDAGLNKSSKRDLNAWYTELEQSYELDHSDFPLNKNSFVLTCVPSWFLSYYFLPTLKLGLLLVILVTVFILLVN